MCSPAYEIVKWDNEQETAVVVLLHTCAKIEAIDKADAMNKRDDYDNSSRYIWIARPAD